MANIYKRGKIYWIRFKFNNKQYCYSLKTDNLAKAEKVKNLYVEKIKSAKATLKVQKEINALNNAMNFKLNTNSKNDQDGWITVRWNKLNSRERQAILFVLYKGICYYCGKDITIPISRKVKATNRAVIDHKIPVVGGGSNNIDNLVLSCEVCNRKKSDETEENFKKELKVDIKIPDERIEI